MPDVQPLRALHYDVAAVGDLERVTAPPYDIIDAPLRADLAARSPYNIVRVDLPEGDDRYAQAARTLDAWIDTGILVRDGEPAIWPVQQEFGGPDGVSRVRTGFFARVRLEDYGPGGIRPHERTHAAAKQDRLDLTRATKTNVSPIFGLYDDPGDNAREAIARATVDRPFAVVADDDGTVNRIWRTADAEAIAALQDVLSAGGVLIADGHHRYETARTYAREVGGDGPHEYVLICLVAMSDPGLVVFPTHRLVAGLDGGALARLREEVERDFDAEPASVADLKEIGSPGYRGNAGTLGYLVAGDGQPRKLALKSAAIVDRALADRAAPYRELDTAILEALILHRALGMTDEDIDRKRNLAYVQDVDEAVSRVRSGEFQAAFIVPPAPVEKVRGVAAAGETMPPKSTYFYPKLLTGLLLNPLTS